jgi:iron complex outermembrane receptor protein
MSQHPFRCLCGSLLVTGVLASAVATAQTVVEPGRQGSADPASDSTSGVQLEEIVVTAQRREESLNKVPISVTALSQQTMDDLNIVTVSDLASIVPGLYQTPVQAGSSQDFSTVVIRGIAGGNNAPTTQFYIDDTPIATRQVQLAGNSMSPQPLIFDLDRVEVLRGPQGTLFGASAEGGAIRYITPQPSLTTESGFAKADVNYVDRGGVGYEVGAAYGGPIVEGTLGFRVSAWYQATGGFVDQVDPATGQILKRNANTAGNYVIRPAFTFAPTDSLAITPAFYLQHTHSENPPGYWTNSLPNSDDGRLAMGWWGQPFTDNFSVSNLSVKYHTGNIEVASDTSFLDRYSDSFNDFTEYAGLYVTGNTSIPGVGGVPANFHNYENDYTNTRAWQQDLRLTVQGSWVNWLTGLYYRRATQEVGQGLSDISPLTEAFGYGSEAQWYPPLPNIVVNGQSLSGYTNFLTTDISEAIYTDLNVHPANRLKIDLGVRVEHQIVQDQSNFTAGVYEGASSAILPDVTANPVTPRASISYQLTDDDMVYTSAAKGFRPGGANPPVAGASACAPSLAALGLKTLPATFGADSLWSYEIGAKGLALDRRLQFEGSVYYTRWTNIQTVMPLPVCYNSFTGNTGLAVAQGADLEIHALLTKDWKLSLLAGYTRAYYPNTLFGAPAVDPVTGLPGTQPTVIIPGGTDLHGVRRWDASATSEYSYDTSFLWAGSRSYIRGDYRYLSGWPPNDLYKDPSYPNYVPSVGTNPDAAYGLLNLRLGVKHGPLDASVYVTNVTNAHPELGFGYAGSLNWATALTPRTVGLTGWYRF